jgi:hypothetical protein
MPHRILDALEPVEAIWSAFLEPSLKQWLVAKAASMQRQVTSTAKRRKSHRR